MNTPKNLMDFDVRVRDRNVKANLLKPEQVKTYIDALPDVADNADAVSVWQPGFPQPERHVHAAPPAAAVSEPSTPSAAEPSTPAPPPANTGSPTQE